MDSHKRIAGAKPPATSPRTPHISSLCRRMSENVAKVQEFIVWVLTTTDVDEHRLSAVPHHEGK